MNLREAAEAALKAMSSFESGTNGLYEGEFAEEIAVLRAALAEPVQEPVAWMDIDREGQRLSVRQWSDGNSDEVPLYTSPPQRKPLTDEEILSISAECAASHQHDDVHLARAIERAHGIGGSNE